MDMESPTTPPPQALPPSTPSPLALPTPGAATSPFNLGATHPKKSHARKQPPGHIPRPRNAFILFRCDFVQEQKVPHAVEKDHRNISRIVGQIWQTMTDEEKAPWVKMAAAEKGKHRRLYPRYQYQPKDWRGGGVRKRRYAMKRTASPARDISDLPSPTAPSTQTESPPPLPPQPALATERPPTPNFWRHVPLNSLTSPEAWGGPRVMTRSHGFIARSVADPFAWSPLPYPLEFTGCEDECLEVYPYPFSLHQPPITPDELDWFVDVDSMMDPPSDPYPFDQLLKDICSGKPMFSSRANEPGTSSQVQVEADPKPMSRHLQDPVSDEINAIFPGLSLNDAEGETGEFRTEAYGV